MNSQTISLRKRTFKAGSWVLIGHFFSQFMRFGGNLILTRLLVPEMFGMMTIVNVIMAGLTMFSDVGLLQNIVQSKRGDDQAYLNTAWTIQIIRGFLIFFIALTISAGLYFLGRAGYFSHDIAYGNAELPAILATISITAVIEGFNSIQLPLLNRKLMVGKLVLIEITSQLVGLVFMVSWAWMTHNIWALVYGSIISVSLKMILSHTVDIGERCQFCWDREAVNEIIHFGKWIFLTSILGFLLNQGDRLLLGSMVSSEILGVYTVAFFLANSLKDALMKLISSVFYPVLSEILRKSSDNVQNFYYRIRARIDVICMLTAGILYSAGDVIIESLYDKRYENAGWMLEILSLSLVSVGFMLAGQLFLSYGKSKLTSILAAFQVLGLYVVVPYCFSVYGLEAAVWAIAINPLIRIIVSIFIMQRYFFLNIYRELMFTPLLIVGMALGEQIKKLLYSYGVL